MVNEAEVKINRALTQIGFASVNPLTVAVSTPRFEASPSDGWYFGSLKTKRGEIHIYLGISNSNFTKPPTVWLSERPAWLLGWRPHLLPCLPPLNEFLCYSDHDQFHLLAHEPDRAIHRVLEDVKITIDRIADPETVVKDSQREISVHWDQSDDKYYCDVEPVNRPQTCLVGIIENDNKKTYLLSKEPGALAKKMGIPAQIPQIFSGVIFPEPSKPLYLTSAGKPTNLKEVWTWLKTTSKDTFDDWMRLMKSAEPYEKNIYYYFFRAGNQLIGYNVFSGSGLLSKIRSARQRVEYLTKNIHQTPLPIRRLSADRLDTTYLVRRNLPQAVADLRAMNILLIGAGTIGGYLAQALVQLGAGAQKDNREGKLVVIDPQKLESQNIGRHVLGLRYLGWNKARALKADISDRRPEARIEAISADVSSIEEDLHQYDLVINATGFEPIGRHLSKIFRQRKWLNGERALLHTWIEGQGGVCRALLEDTEKFACFDCMWSYADSQGPRLRRPAYSDENWNDRSSDGYSTMTPFAVSASMASTAVAIDMILGWRKKSDGPRFRSRSAEGEGIKPSTSCNLSRHEKCPTCSI